jgi:ABC-type uncharacterized transport system auxiliary subunit
MTPVSTCALKVTLLSFAACLFFIAGCGANHPIKYYEVNYPSKDSVAPDAVNTGLLVRSFETSRLYLDDRIVYGFDSPEMGTYEYQRWAEPPAEMLQSALVRGLRASGRFKSVYSMRTDPDGRFILAGHLYDFKEVDSANGIVARLNYTVRLRDRKAARTVWEYSYNYDEPATEKSVTAFVLAMDKNLQRSVQAVQAGLEEYFRAHPLQ